MCNCCEKIEMIKEWLAQKGEIIRNEDISNYINEIMENELQRSSNQ